MSLLKRVFSAAEITGVATQYSSCEIVGPPFSNGNLPIKQISRDIKSLAQGKSCQQLF